MRKLRILVKRCERNKINYFLDKQGYKWRDGQSLLDKIFLIGNDVVYNLEEYEGNDVVAYDTDVDKYDFTVEDYIDKHSKKKIFYSWNDFYNYRFKLPNNFILSEEEKQLLISYHNNECDKLEFLLDENYDLIGNYPEVERAIGDEIDKHLNRIEKLKGGC